MQQPDRPVRWELYDLSTDIGEQHDLADDYSEVVDRLQRQWQSTDAEMQPALFQ